jgi:formamidopyrimidine-DNA glycosylase
VPELPEIRAHAERLDAGYAGLELTGFRALSFTAQKTYDPSPERAVGHALRAVRWRGKHLLLAFEPVTFVVHLMQGGRLREDLKQSARPRGGLARWQFGSRPALLLSEASTEKRAGVWVIQGDPEQQEPLGHLGPDADAVTRAELADRVRSQSGRIHGVLRDQTVLAGIGRRLANEICFRAGLSPFANSAKLADDEIGRLYEAMAYCLEEGLTYERTRDDMSAAKDRPGAVHHRKGQECPVCGDSVRTVEYSSYTVAYCPTCQTDGKILADNTTSRFLK